MHWIETIYISAVIFQSREDTVERAASNFRCYCTFTPCPFVKYERQLNITGCDFILGTAYNKRFVPLIKKNFSFESSTVLHCTVIEYERM